MVRVIPTKEAEYLMCPFYKCGCIHTACMAWEPTVDPFEWKVIAFDAPIPDGWKLGERTNSTQIRITRALEGEYGHCTQFKRDANG